MKLPRKKLILLLSFGLIFALVAFSFFYNRRIEKTSPRSQRGRGLPVEVVSYNAHLLPPIVNRIIGKRGATTERAIAIAAALREFDIIGICESFDENATAILIDEFSTDPDQPFSFVRSPAPQGLTQLTSGGLVLLSRLPIDQQNTLTFSSGSRFLTSRFQSGDGLAAKGALHARIKIDDSNATEIDCFLTHLDSYDRAVRADQIRELVAFISENSRPGNLRLILGDFNISAAGPIADLPVDSKSEYAFLLEQLSNGPVQIRDTAVVNRRIPPGTSDALSENGGDRIDYIFVGLPDSDSEVWTTTSKTLRLLDSKMPGGSLSDHAAVWCRIDSAH